MKPTHAHGRAISWFLALVLILCTTIAMAGTFTSTHGYSLDYPDDWTVADPAVSSRLESEADQALSSSSGGEYGVDAVILAPSGETFTPNLNVVVSPGPTPVSDTNIGAVRQDFAALHAKQGAELRDLSVTVETVAGRAAYSLRYEAVMPGREAPLWQWLVIVSDADTTHHLTCSCLPGDRADLMPAFEQMIGSLRLQAPPSSRRLWHGAAVLALGCCVAACVVALRLRRSSAAAGSRADGGQS